MTEVVWSQAAAASGDSEGVERCLKSIAEGLSAICHSLGRMTEKCDPHIYYERVRLPTSGWRDNPAMPHGLLYEGKLPALKASCLLSCAGMQQAGLPRGFDELIGHTPVLLVEDCMTALAWRAGVWTERRQFHGASGAQSSIIPALDGALGVQHPAGWLRDYLAIMRLHMPPAASCLCRCC